MNPRLPHGGAPALLALATLPGCSGGSTGSLALCIATLAPVELLPRSEAVAEPAVVLETVSVDEGRALSVPVMTAAFGAAHAAGGRATVTVGGTMGMRRLLRGKTLVQRTRPNFQIPLTFTAMDPNAASAIYGPEIGAALANGQVVMSQSTADLRGALQGDAVELVGWNKRVRILPIAVVSTLAPSELLMSIDTAKVLGAKRLVRVVIWGFPSRESIEGQLGAYGLLVPTIRTNRSWEPKYSDDLLGQAQVKALLGEFGIKSSGSILIEKLWRDSRLVTFTFMVGPRRVTTKCHKVVANAAMAAFAEINALGLASLVVVRNRNTAVGCYGPRTVRAFGSTTGRNLSRHSWGMALDFNTRDNCMGCVPKMDCRIVQVFRAHGFAWGGNFLIPDGMHFEYVGEPRDQVPTRPGGYCPTGALPAAQGPPVGAAALATDTELSED